MQVMQHLPQQPEVPPAAYSQPCILEDGMKDQHKPVISQMMQ